MTIDDRTKTVLALAEEVRRQLQDEIDVYREALSWIATHDNVSIAHARRAQRVAAGALYEGKAPDEVLQEREP